MSKGTITQKSLQKMQNDYQKNLSIVRKGAFGSGKVVTPNEGKASEKKGADINRAIGSDDVGKINSFYFSKTQFQNLLNSNPEAESIEISIGVQLPNSIIKCGKMKPVKNFNVSNDIAVIISMAKKGEGKDLSTIAPCNDINDKILITGYNDIVPDIAFAHLSIAEGGGATISESSDCCPGTNPPNGNNNGS